MTHEFTLVLASPHVTEEQCNALFEAGCDDGTISTSLAVTRIDFSREALKSGKSHPHRHIRRKRRLVLQVLRAEIRAECLANQSK